MESNVKSLPPAADPARSGSNLNQLPLEGYVRLLQLIGDPDANPPIPPIIPVGKSSIWAWVKSGRMPAPIKLSPKVTVWRVSDIRQFLDKQAA